MPAECNLPAATGLLKLSFPSPTSFRCCRHYLLWTRSLLGCLCGQLGLRLKPIFQCLSVGTTRLFPDQVRALGGVTGFIDAHIILLVQTFRRIEIIPRRWGMTGQRLCTFSFSCLTTGKNALGPIA
jgi:hypothetical protein